MKDFVNSSRLYRGRYFRLPTLREYLRRQNSLTCRRSNDLEPVILSTAAAETTRVRSAAGHGSWTIRTVSAGPTSCVGAVYLLTSDKMWRRRMSIRGRSRQHLFLHGPSKLSGHSFKPGNGHVSGISPWAQSRDRSTRGLSMARCPPVAPSLIEQPRGRADLSEPRSGWARQTGVSPS